MGKGHKKKKNHADHRKHAHITSGVRERVDYPRRDHREEFAAEVASLGAVASVKPTAYRKRVFDVGITGSTAGYTGIAMGILAMFIWSLLLGSVAAVLGFYAFVNGKKTLGCVAIGLGLVAMISYIPFAR